VLLAGCESEWPMEKRLDSRCDFFLSAMVVGVFWTGEEGSGRPQRRAEGRRVGGLEGQRVRWACYTASVQCFIQDAQGSGTNERRGQDVSGDDGDKMTGRQKEHGGSRHGRRRSCWRLAGLGSYI
jgi:hypothetical protein